MVKLLNIMSFLALLIFNAQRAILSYKSGNAILLQRISDRFDCDKRLNYGQWKVYWLIIVQLLLFCVHPRYECLSLSIVCDLLWHAYRILFTKPIPAVNCTNCCTHTEHTLTGINSHTRFSYTNTGISQILWLRTQSSASQKLHTGVCAHRHR